MNFKISTKNFEILETKKRRIDLMYFNFFFLFSAIFFLNLINHSFFFKSASVTREKERQID